MGDRHVEGSSSGTGHSDDRCKTIQVNAYVKDDAKVPGRHSASGCTPVMVSITGSSGLREQRNPIDVVLVLHVHILYTAPANWHDLVNRATALLVEKLGDDDRLAVVPALLKEAQVIFGDAVIAPIKPRLLVMSPENKAAACKAVVSSEAMRTNSPLVRDLESAESILYGRTTADKEKRAGYIIVISNSNENLSSVLSWRLRCVHAFGFRSAQNARAMHAITNRGDSTYAILDDDDEEAGNSNNQIAHAFTAIVDKITSATEPVKVELKCNEEVLLSEIYGPRICYFISYDKKVGIIWAHARRHSAPTNFVVLLEIPDDYYEYENMLQVDAKLLGHDDGDGGHSHTRRPPHQVVVVRKGMDGSIQVAAEIVRMEALRVVAEITDEEVDRNDNQKLLDKLRQWRTLLELNFGREAGEAEEVQKLALEMQQMQDRLQENNMWLEYMLSWQLHQWWPLRPLIMDGNYVDSGVNKMAITDHSSLLRTRILAKLDAILVPVQKPQRGIPVLVHIKVPSDLDEGKGRRVPIDLVAVIDVRIQGNEVNEQRLTLLNKAMGLVMEKLSDKDRLSMIVSSSAHLADTDTEPAAAFQHMTIQGRSECMKMLSALTSVSKTTQQASQRRDQPSKALCLPRAAVNSSWMALCGSTRLSKSLKDAVKRLDDRDDKRPMGMGLIMVISDTHDDDNVSVSHGTLSPKYAIHAFSFCSVDNNARAVYRIASRSMGIYGILSDDQSNEITQAFRAFISNITSTIAVNTKVSIVCSSSGAKLCTIESGHFKSRINHDKKSGDIYAGALCPGEERRFVVYVDNVRDDEYGRRMSKSKMLEVTATCLHWQHDEFKEDKSDEQKIVIARGKDPGSKELVEEIIRIEELKTLGAIADPKIKIDLVLRKMQQLRKRLKAQQQQQQQAADVEGGVRTRRRSADYYYAMAVDEESLASLASDEDGSQLSYMLSWLSFQGLCQQPPLLLLPAPPTTPRRRGTDDRNSPQHLGRP